ncbi:ABC transporter substrate-binding protein [Thalassospira sp. HJ]|uniref:substrate-binding periplasmic protein n=1 Tax=Thalassospira sp. HJ TaxID=1616823 RepID=UPI0005CEB9D2|nr:transporter substrate-binding domain-containing protein [Thalassospira sp. HJ]KJE34345.1 ABC transporter substrate-binding protein [Thalassospira sp. HJ]
MFYRLAVAVLSFLILPLIARAEETLVIATNIYPPYVNEDVENSFLPELFAEIGTEMGVTFEIRILPWRRCEQSVSDLEAWGAIPYTHTEERDLKYLFSDTLYVSDSKFFAYSDLLKESFSLPPKTFQTFADLQSWNIGGIQGYYYEEIFAEAGLTVDYVRSESQGFELLAANRIDLFPASVTVGWHTIRSMFPPEIANNFYTLDKPLSDGGTLHLMTSKDYPNTDILLKRFNTAMAKIKSSGTYAQLAEKHGLVLRY